MVDLLSTGLDGAGLLRAIDSRTVLATVRPVALPVLLGQYPQSYTSVEKERIMTDPMEVVEKLCERYQTAVSNNDSGAYRKLFAEDAIRIPPGSEPEHGPDEIGQGEQRDYDIAKWTL